MLEGRTNISQCVFEAPFKGVSTIFGRRYIEKGFEKIPIGCSDFHNLRLGCIDADTKKHQTIIYHASRVCWLCFCKPILAILLQRKHQTIIYHASRMLVGGVGCVL